MAGRFLWCRPFVHSPTVRPDKPITASVIEKPATPINQKMLDLTFL